MAKKDSEDMIRVQDLEMGDHLGYAGVPSDPMNPLMWSTFPGCSLSEGDVATEGSVMQHQ